MNSEPRLLLSSLKTFEWVIKPLLEHLSPHRVCEIGVDKGIFTTFLADFCRAHAAHYVGIDPTLPDETAASDEHLSFLKQPSVKALQTLEPQDVYFVDGDHNYYTVLNELRLIFARPESAPLVFLHDVGWPWARRDQYCAPDTIPAEFRHPSSTTLGAVPGHSALQDWGFAGEGSDYAYAAASFEGGPRNGVLTAVEDALTEPRLADYRLLIIPVVFGLGILYNPKKIPAKAHALLGDISAALDCMHPILIQMEENRIALFLDYLKIWRHSHDLETRYRELEKHDRTLQTRYDELCDHSRTLQGLYDSLAQHTRDLQAAYEAQAARANAADLARDQLAGQLNRVERERDFLANRLERITRPWRGLMRKFRH